jgi:hypothetical protein
MASKASTRTKSKAVTRVTRRTDGDFGEVFDRLKKIAQKHGKNLLVSSDTAQEFILTAPPPPGQKKEFWFGGVRVGKAYVSYHLMAVYMFPDLLKEVSDALRACMQGKSCFNFKRVEPELFAELDELTRASVKRLRREGIQL